MGGRFLESSCKKEVESKTRIKEVSSTRPFSTMDICALCLSFLWKICKYIFLMFSMYLQNKIVWSMKNKIMNS